MMSTTPLIVAAVCVVILVVLFLMRGMAALKGEIPKPAAIGLIVVSVLVAAGLLYRFMTAPPALVEGEGGDAGMMGEGGMGGGMRAPSPQRELGQLVRKMVLMKSQDSGAFTAEQEAKLLPVLKALAKAEAMDSEEATAKKGEIQGILTEPQTAALDALELPRRRRGGPSGGAPPRPAADEGAPPPPPAGGAPGGGAPGGGAPGGGAPGGGAPGGGAPGGGAPGGGGRGDWRAAMRARMLETPYVKKLYDEKAATDPAFATDDEKQSEFFRGLRSTLSPFLRGPSQEALQELIKEFTP